MIQARRLRSALIRFCVNLICVSRTHPFWFLAFIFLVYLVLSAVGAYNRLNSALDAHTLALTDLPVDLVEAIKESIRNKQPLRYTQPPYDNTTINAIPRIIHRTYKTLAIPPKWMRAFNTCVDYNPGYTQYFWTDESARKFIEDRYSWFLPTYDKYTFTIQRVDALRYFLLWTYGGIYIDLDVTCRQSLDPLLQQASAFFPRTWPYGVSNDVMASTAGHPLIAKAALSLHEHDKFYISKYITVLLTTGPMFLNHILSSWFRAVKLSPSSSGEGERSRPPPYSVAILPSMFYDSTPYTFFGHLPGSSWHGDDAKFVRWICNRLTGVGMLFFGSITLAATVFWFRSRKQRLSLSRGMYIPMTYSRDTGTYYGSVIYKLRPAFIFSPTSAFSRLRRPGNQSAAS